MSVVIFDAQGRRVYRREFSTWSREAINVSNGVYSESGLMELFEMAIRDSYLSFLEDVKTEKRFLF